MIQLAIIYSKTKLSGRLTKFWTGEYAYHCGFLDAENDTFYEMNIMPRAVSWAAKNYKDYSLHPTNLTAEDCFSYLKQDALHVRYGVFDYAMFALRPVYHLFGQSTRNFSGEICSEWLNKCLWRKTPNATQFNPKDAPPSPADFARLYT